MFQVSSRLELWAGELEHSELSNDMKEAETLLRLHSESVTHMQNTTFQVLQQGQELAQVTVVPSAGKQTISLLKLTQELPQITRCFTKVLITLVYFINRTCFNKIRF